MAVRIGIVLISLLAAAGASAYVLSLPGISFRTVSYNAIETPLVPPKPSKPKMTHVATPSAVKAIYMSQCYASSSNLRKKLISIAETTEINAIIVDVKDYTGTISFTPKNKRIKVGGEGCRVSDMQELIAEMHAKNIYVIGRITVFQDPYLTSIYPQWAVKRVTDPSKNWVDRKGLAFFDVGAREYWDYVVAISRDAHDIGFDELNYDYVRFPSDGNMKDAFYSLSQHVSKAEQLERFFKYLTEQVRAPYDSLYDHGEHIPVLSADLFGMTATNKDDLTIGQVLERAVPYFDYVAPMVYPSHYPPGFNGYRDPNKNVYGVIKYSMDKAVARLAQPETDVEALAHIAAFETVVIKEKNADGVEVEKTIIRPKQGYYTKSVYPPTKLRTWIQDFDYGGDYGPKEVRDQIQATYDAGLTSWMIWSPSNRYTTEALNKM